MLDVRRLRVLREVARRGSLAGAADVLSYTPSAVSQQIAALEREAGTRLLERRARGVVLTEAGQTGGQTAARACARAGFVPRVAYESDDYTAIRELVGAGAGIALLPDLAKFPPHESVVLRSLGPDRPFRNIQVATRPEAFRSPAASEMLKILCEQRPAPVPQVAGATPPSR